MAPLKIFDDPEAIFQEGWMFCDAGDHRRGLEYLQRGVARGYFAAPTLTGWPQFDALRDLPAFQTMLAEAEAGRRARSPRFERPAASSSSRADAPERSADTGLSNSSGRGSPVSV